MDQHANGAGFHAESSRLIGQVDLVGKADLEKMIARAERAELSATAFDGALAERIRIGAREAAELFGMQEILKKILHPLKHSYRMNIGASRFQLFRLMKRKNSFLLLNLQKKVSIQPILLSQINGEIS